MRFTKMHGLGNDYVYVNCLSETINDPASVAREVSDRHFGIGSDGLILIRPSKQADFFMEMFNADGSRSAMCGNGIRCVGKYVYDHGLTDKTKLDINTLAGIKHLQLHVEDGAVASVTVDMGEPILEPALVPVAFEADRVVDEALLVDSREYRITCVSMGNPHAVTFVDSVGDVDVEHLGPLFENHELFPQRTNAEFIEVLGPNEIRMRVWERGAGETLACGTGACASVVACALNGRTGDDVTVHLLGGDLHIRWDRASGHVFMSGPAVTVFEGTMDVHDAEVNQHEIGENW